MQNFQDSIIDKNTGRPIAGATVDVYDAGTTNHATIYVDDGITQKDNPFTVGDDGEIEFYAANGKYDVRVAGTTTDGYGITPETKTVLLFDSSFSVKYAEKYPGADASIKILAALAELPNGGTVDCRGFGATTQVISSLVSGGTATKPITFLFDPSTIFQPATSSTDMFAISAGNIIRGLHIDTTNFANYSGKPLKNDPAQGIEHAAIEHVFIKNHVNSTAPCIYLSGTSSTGWIQYAEFRDITCYGGTEATGLVMTAANSGWVNANHFDGLKVYGTKYGVELLVTDETGGVGGNVFDKYEYEAWNQATSIGAVHMNSASASNNMAFNRFQMNAYDMVAGYGVKIDTGYIGGNYFIGLLGDISDGGTSLTRNQFNDLAVDTKVAHVDWNNVFTGHNYYYGNSDTVNGQNIRGYSDEGTSLTFRLDAGLGKGTFSGGVEANVDGILGGNTPAAASVTSLAVGGGTPITKIVVYSQNCTPSTVSTATIAEQTFTVSGLVPSDKIIVNPPAIANATGIAGARVSGTDTMAIRFINPTSGSLVPTAGTYVVIALRS